MCIAQSILTKEFSTYLSILRDGSNLIFDYNSQHEDDFIYVVCNNNRFLYSSSSGGCLVASLSGIRFSAEAL